MLSGLHENLLHPDFVREFADEYQKEWNRLRQEEEALRGQEAAELSRVNRQISNIFEAVKAGLFQPSMKTELGALDLRKANLEGKIAREAEETLRLHPGLVDIYRS